MESTITDNQLPNISVEEIQLVDTTQNVNKNEVTESTTQDQSKSEITTSNEPTTLKAKELGATPNAKQILPQVQKIKYPKCQKGNFHEGEYLNYVLLNSTNKEEVLGCAVCQEENRNSQWKPLKVILHQALENSSKQTNSQFNPDEILQYLEEQKAKASTSLDAAIVSMTDKLNLIKATALNFFDKMKDQILALTSASTTVNELFNSVYDFQEDVEVLKTSVHRLINFIPLNDEEEVIEQKNLEKKAIQSMIDLLYSDIDKKIEISNKEIEALLETQKQAVQELLQNAKLSEKKEQKFYFSPSLKHSQITLVSPTIAKSNGTTTGYRFAILEPVLPTHKVTKFAFKIKNISQTSWLALGICHKNIVVQKNYNFQFSTTGHGAYMVSTNSGSWSTSVPANNNAVKAFKFAKNDTIIIEHDPIQKVVKFTKEKSPSSTYKLDFTPIENDPFHACVLFFYVNDEIEFIPNYETVEYTPVASQLAFTPPSLK